MNKEVILGKTPEEIKKEVLKLGLPAFNGRQIVEWIYQKKVLSFEQMTNLSNKTRALLTECFEFGVIPPSKVQISQDGTKKYLYPTATGKFIEAAYIPDKERATLCVSSQVGCKMGCLFCMTAKQGFQGNLSAAEILNQVLSLPEVNQLTNLVYMGMGEPFDNLNEVLRSLEILTAEDCFGWSPKRITVSTVGIIPGMKEFLQKSKCHLAVSLHTPFDEERRRLMPVQHVYPLKDVLEEIRSFDFGLQRRVSFEYIVFKGLNDTARHVKEMARILNGIKCRVNLIRFHAIPGTPLEGSDLESLQHFKEALNEKGILTTIRASRGEDIYAACGLLSTKEFQKKNETDTLN